VAVVPACSPCASLCPQCRLKKKALQGAYDQAIKRKMVGGVVQMGGVGVDRASLARCRRLQALRCCCRCTPPPSLASPHRLPPASAQEEEAAARLGGRGLEEIAAEPVRRPEESGECRSLELGMQAAGDTGVQVSLRGASSQGAVHQSPPLAVPPFCCACLPLLSLTLPVATPPSSVYFHPTLNPMGIPPPGKPQK
jgi:hypothetical protein